MINIRIATRSDVHDIYELMLDIARHHNQEKYLKTSPEIILEAAFGDQPRFCVLLAENDHQIAGYLSYTFNYSIWLGVQYAHLDDLFVKDSYRGMGVGQSLMNAFREICLEKQIHQAKWEVEADNTRAIKFYERIGAEINVKGIFKWSM